MITLARNSLILILLGWCLLLVGYSLDSQWLIGASVLVFLALAVERWAEVVRERGDRR